MQVCTCGMMYNVPEEPPQSMSDRCTLERVHSHALFLHHTQTLPQVQKSIQINLKREMEQVWKKKKANTSET